MLRASLGKVVHIVQRAGTRLGPLQRKSHFKNYTKSLYMSGLCSQAYEQYTVFCEKYIKLGYRKQTLRQIIIPYSTTVCPRILYV